MKERRHNIRLAVYAIMTLSIMILIFLFSAQHGAGSQNLSDGFLRSFAGRILGAVLPGLTDDMGYDIRKYAHMFEYFCLGISASLLFWEIFIQKEKRTAKTFASAEGLSFFYACTDEFHQLFVPERAGRFSDVMVDAVGFTAASVLMYVLFAIYLHFLDKEHRAVYH